MSSPAGRRRPRPAPVVEVLPPETAIAPIAQEAPDALALTAETAAKVERIVAEGTAPATALAYRSDMRYFERWAGLTYGAAPFPVPVAVLVRFVVDHLDEGPDPATDAALLAEGIKARPGCLSLATVSRRVASLSKAHTLAKVEPNPCRSMEVRELLSRARRRAASQGRRPRKKSALTRDRLDLLLATCGEDLPGVRDRALLLLAFSSGGRRRSEVAAVNVEDLVRVEGGGFTFTMGRSKTDQEGAGVTLPVLGRAAAALEDWLAASGVKSGPLFRRLRPIGPGGRGGFTAGPDGLAGQAVALIVKRRATLAGLDPRAFAAHSLRSGFVTESGRAGIPLADAMALSGHRSLRIALGYFQAGSVLTNRAARMAD